MALTLNQINTAQPAEFVALLDGTYEHSPWIVERALARRPFASLVQLKLALVEVVREAGRDTQLALIRAHPELAGKAMVSKTLTAESTNEQGKAGLTDCTPDEFARIQRLNADYNAKFGFPFILAVRGPRGLGLNEEQVEALTDFIENGLYDPAFVHFDPKSTTRMFQLSPPDFIYSKFRPDLVEAGQTDNHPTVDGRPLSGLPQDNNDALSRRDMGLEYLDVTSQVNTTLLDSNRKGKSGQHRDVYELKNNSDSIVVDTHLLIVVQGLSSRIRLKNASGTTSSGDPYVRVFLPDGVLLPGNSIVQTLFFEGPANAQAANYSLKLLSGQGIP